jgi:hypothetical protein
MSAQILQRIYALNIHLLTSRTKGFFITLPFLYLFHSNLLLVEALGTAPKSSLPFDLFHQTVSLFSILPNQNFVNPFFQIPLSILYVPSARTKPICVSGSVIFATENTAVFIFLKSV